MAFKDFENHLRGAAAAAIILATSTRLEAKELQQKQKDAEKPKTEQAATPQQKDDKAIDFFGVASVEQVEQDGQTYHVIDDKTVIAPEMLDENKFKREFKKDEKELWKNAEQDRIHQDTITLSNVSAGGTFCPIGKNINIPYIQNDLNDNSNSEEVAGNADLANSSYLSKKAEQHNDQTSPAFAALMAHEEQHRTNNKLGIYAPGLSAEQYAIINQYDEASALVAELSAYTKIYQDKLKNGASKEEALAVFDTNKSFSFYKEALANGLDPESKEGKAKMVTGSLDAWKNEISKHPLYKNQIFNTAESTISKNSFTALAVGNEEEMQKRIDAMFNNVLIDGKPTKMSRYMPEEKLELSAEIKENIGYRVRDKIGLTQEDREQLGNISQKEMIEALTGRKPSPKAKNKNDNSSQTNINPMSKNNSNQR